jgi:hypothetical protein
MALEAQLDGNFVDLRLVMIDSGFRRNDGPGFRPRAKSIHPMRSERI